MATSFGPVAVKISGDTIAPEADSVAAAAEKSATSFKIIYQAAIAAYWQSHNPNNNGGNQ